MKDRVCGSSEVLCFVAMGVDVVLRHVSMHDAVCVHEGGNDFRQ